MSSFARFLLHKISESNLAFNQSIFLRCLLTQNLQNLSLLLGNLRCQCFFVLDCSSFVERIAYNLFSNITHKLFTRIKKQDFPALPRA